MLKLREYDAIVHSYFQGRVECQRSNQGISVGSACPERIRSLMMSLERHRFFHGVNKPYKSHRYLLPRGLSTVTINGIFPTVFCFRVRLVLSTVESRSFLLEITPTRVIRSKTAVFAELRNQEETMSFFLKAESRVFRQQLTD